jgi:hypothetical protein
MESRLCIVQAKSDAWNACKSQADLGPKLCMFII